MLLEVTLAALCLLSLGLALWQWGEAGRFPLHKGTSSPEFAPPITLLKPLRGADSETPVCLQSWLDQTYPGPVQVLFGVESAQDPAVAVILRLMSENPGRDLEWVVCPESRGANGKVSKLIQLWPRVKHDRVILSDADVWVPPEFLANIVAPLRDPVVGLVTALYRLGTPHSPALRWEAVAVNADFWCQVLQARSLGMMDFALGAVMAIPRAQLEAIGGFDAVADHLADDFQLGRLIARNGGRIELSPLVAECREPARTWGETWRHQLRWARTIRACRPTAYSLSLINNVTLWSAGCCATGIWSPPGIRTGLMSLGILAIGVRILTAMHNQSRIEQNTIPWNRAWLLPVKDLLQAALWAASFTGNTVDWRGERFRIGPGGRLIRLPVDINI